MMTETKSSNLSEREIISVFLSDVDSFARTYGVSDLRLYMEQMPVFTPDGTKYADVVLESAPKDHVVVDNHDNPMYVLEFKKNVVDYHDAVYQVTRYVDTLRKQCYRQHVEGFVVAPGFSEHEKKFAKEHNVKLCSFDPFSKKFLVVQGIVEQTERRV